jgi:hypothetical protein
MCIKWNSFEGYPRNRILYVVDDDEIALYSGFYELPTQVDDFLSLLFRQQRYFMIFLFVMLLIELSFIHYAYTHMEENVQIVKPTIGSF